ncbi:MAG: hypothetical protein FWG65_08680 [Turicibacter sp.]|nr:hypothetical protein [Turicibacter sp.]
MNNLLFRLIFLSLQVRFTNMTNRLIYFFQKLPLIKRLISPDIYKLQELKTVFLVFGIIFVISKKLLFFVLFMALILLPFGAAISFLGTYENIFDVFNPEIDPIGVFTATDVVGNMFVAWFIVSFLGATVNSTLIGSEHWQNDETMINLLRVNPTHYAKSRILADRLSDLIIWLPTLLIGYAILLDGGFLMILWAALATLVVYTAFRLIAESVNMWFFQKMGKHLGSNGWAAFAFMTIFLVLGFATPFLLGTPDFNGLFGIFSVVAVILAGAVIYFLTKYIGAYPLYFNFMNYTVQRYRGTVEKYYKSNQDPVGADQKSAQNWAKEVDTAAIEQSKLDKHRNKTGLAYLNAIFFDRHHNFFRRKMIIRIVLVLAPLVLATLFAGFAVIFLGTTPAEILGLGVETAEEISEFNAIFEMTPTFFLIIYFLSMGRIVTGTVFINCDIHMLHYPYYRQSRIILSSFAARIKVILGLNLLNTSLLGVSVIGSLWILAAYMDWQLAAMFFVTLTLIGLVLGFNDLFLYYIIQPYDTDGKGKSFAYNVINWVTYMLAFAFMQISMDLLWFTIGWAALTLIYFGVGTIALLKFAPRRFRLR